MRTSIFLSLIVFSFHSAFAQSPAMDEPISLRQQFLSVVDSPSFTQPRVPLDTRQWQPFDVPTIGVQALFGATGGSMFALAGYHMGSSDGGLEGLFNGAALGYFGGALIGVPLGVLLGGEMMGGDGDVLPVLGGSATGTAVGLLALFVMDDNVAAPVVVLGVLGGPILSYHLSAGPPADRIREGSAIPPSRPSLGGAALSPTPRYLMNAANPTIPRPEIEMTVLALRF